MKKYIPFFASFLFILNVQGQEIQFDLNEYVRPDFERRSFDFRPSFNTAATYAPNLTNSTTGNLRFGFFGRYQSIKNDEKTQSALSISPDIDFGSSNTAGSDFSFGYDIDLNHRYFHKKERFFIVDLNSDFDYTTRNDPSFSDVEIGVKPKVGYGFGRVEYVGNGAHVLRLLNMLKEQGKLTSMPDSANIQRLIDEVTILKNQRFFDSRLQQIREIEQILMILDEIGVLTDPDFFAFALFSDAYQYENVLNNFSTGNSLEITVGRNLSYLKSQGFLTSADFKFDVVYNDYKMINYKTNTRLYGGVDFAYYRTDFGNRIQNRYAAVPFIGYDLMYSPTARIFLNFDNFLGYNLNIERDGQVNQDRSYVQFSSRAILSYYFSPRLRLNGVASIRTLTEVEDVLGIIEDRYAFIANVNMLYSIY